MVEGTVAAQDERDRSGERPSVRVWAEVVAIWAGSRVLYLVAGALAHALISSADFAGTYKAPSGALSYWANWDGAWYSLIAQHGYFDVSATAFFPVYPILIRGVMTLGAGPALAGVLISIAALLAALFFMYRLAEHWWDARVARTGVIAVALFPSAFYLNAAYTESVFLAFTSGALWAVYVRGDFATAGLLAYFAAGTRSVGVLVAIPIAAEWIRRRRELGWVGLRAVVAAPAALGTYSLYLWEATQNHSPLAFSLEEKATWGRATTDPLVTIARGWRQAGQGLPYLFHPERVLGTTSSTPPFALGTTINFAVLVVVLLLVVLGFRQLPLPVAAYAALVALTPLTLPGPQVALTSFLRYAIAPFPLFFVLGRLLSRSRPALGLWLAVSVAVGVYLTCEFVTLRWVA